MTYFQIGVGTKGARNIPFDFVGASTIPNDPRSQQLKKAIAMNPKTDIGDAHVGAGHSEGLWISKFLRYNAMQAGDSRYAASIAESFYPSDPKTGKWDGVRSGLKEMDVAKQTGDGKMYTDVLGQGADGKVQGSSTLWGVARNHWADFKTELLKRTTANQIMHDKKQFTLDWMHDDINKAKLEEALAFSGIIPNFATKILDKDQLAQAMGVPVASRDAKKIFDSIVSQAAQRGQISETIVGTAGIGKTTEAIKRAGGANFVTSAADLNPSDQLVVVRAAQSVVDSPEFTKAGKITFLKGAKDVVMGMRDKRSKQIRSGTSQTGFGRDANQKFGSTSGILTEALLAEKYSNKLSVFERQADMSLKQASEFEKINEIKGATATIGAFAPFTSGHSDMARQAGASVAFVSKGASRDYDIGLSTREKAKLIELANPNMMAVPGTAGIQEHFEHGGKAYRMRKADTKVALGADRVSGGAEDMTKSFGAFKGVTAVQGRLGGVSGTKIRKAVVDGDLNTLKNNLPPEVFRVIKNNIPVLQKRAAYIQDRKDKAAKGMSILDEDFAAFKAKYGNKKVGELGEITEAREMFKNKRRALKARMSGYGGKAWDRLGLNLNFASEGFVPSFAYKGLHEKDFGTTMVGRKGAMGTNLSDEQVQKMTAGMRMIRGPEGETLVVATDMAGRSGRMIATGLTARKIKKAGPAWRTMLNEVPHLFDGLAYDLVGGVAGANWDPEGTTGAMAGIKFENEMAASLGQAKPGAKKGSDFVVGEKIAANLKTQKNIQAKLALHERSKRDKTKVVDIASSFSKYLVDILSHNIKTHGLSSVTTPDRFQQAMAVLNQNPAVKKDWAKTFGPMGMQSMGLIPNFARTWKSQTKGSHGKFRDGKSSPAKGSPGIYKKKRVSHSKFKAGGFKGFGGFVPNFYFAEADAYQQFGQSLEDKERAELLRNRGKATWDEGMGMDFGDAESATSNALEAEINSARVAASQGKALRAMGVPEYLATYGTGAVRIPPPGSVSFNTQDQGARDRLKAKYGIESDERPTFNAVFNEEDARRNVARRKMAIKKNMTGRQFQDTFSDSKKSKVMDNTTEALREQRNVTKDEVKSEIHTSAGFLASQYGFWGGVFPKNSTQSSWYNSLEGVFKNAYPDANRILITSTEEFVKNKGLANKGIDGTTQVDSIHGTGLSHEMVARSNPTLNELESVDFKPLAGNEFSGLSQVDMGMLNKTGEFGKYASDKETIKAYTVGLEKMVINTLGAKAFTTVLDQAKMDRFMQMRGKMDSSTLRSFGTFARGLVPNFAEDALKAAIGREKAAGQGQPRVGYDSRLKSSGGIGVYNTTEGSLSNAINMHLASGNTITGIQSQGASQGLVPNFASDSLDTAMLMGSLSMMAFSLKDIGQAGKALLQSTEGTEEQINAAKDREKQARDEMISAIEEAKQARLDADSSYNETIQKAAQDRETAERNILETGAAEMEPIDAKIAEQQGQVNAAVDLRDRAKNTAEGARKTANETDMRIGELEMEDEALRGSRAKPIRNFSTGEEVDYSAETGVGREGRDERKKQIAEELEALKRQSEQAKEAARLADEEVEVAKQAIREEQDILDKKKKEKKAIERGVKAELRDAEASEANAKAEANERRKEQTQPSRDQAKATAQSHGEARQETKRLEGGKSLKSRLGGFVEGGGAMAMMTSGPMIGGVASQFMGKDNLSGKATAEGVGNAVGMVGTGVQMGQAFGGWGMAAGAVLGLGAGVMMAGDNIKKAEIAEKLEAVGKEAEAMGTKLNSVTSGGQAYMDSLDKLDKMMKDQSGNVTADDLAKVRSKMTEALAEVPQEFQARFKAAAGDAEKIKEIFGEITQDLQKSKNDLDAAKMGYELQKEFGSGARGMSFWSADTKMFDTLGGGVLSAEGKRVQAQMKQAIGMALNKEDLEKAIDSGMDVDFSNMANMQKFTGEGFGAMLENLQGKVDDSDIQHIGKLMQDVFDRMKSGAKIAAQATRDLQKKNALDQIQIKQQKALNRAIEDFNTIVGKSVKGIQDRLVTIAQLTDKVKEFTIDLAQEDLKGARQLEDPFMSKEMKVRAELIDKSFEIKTASLVQFRKAVSDGTKRNLEVFVKKFTDLNQKVIKQTAGLATKSGKEQLGELARNRKAQEAMIPVIEEAFKVWATAPKDINAMKAVTAKTAQILKNNRIAENNAENAAKLLLEEIKQSGTTTVNELALAVQQRNQQLEIAERQAYWAERSAQLQERIASFGGQGEIFGSAGMAGLSKSFEGMANVLGAQIKGAVSTSIVDVGRANAQLLDQLINKMNFDQLRDIGPGIAPLLSSAIAGRTEDINRQVGFARRVSGIVAPDMQLPDVDAEKVATEQIAAQLKLNQMPDDIAEIRKNSEILNRLVALQTNTLVGANEGAFDDALKLNGIPTNMRAAALGTQVTAKATDKVRQALRENVLKSGYQVGQSVGKVRMTNELGFENLLGASAEFQTLAANIPADFAKANGLAIGVGLDSLQTALTNSMGQIGTNVAEALRNFRDPIEELNEATAAQRDINLGAQKIKEAEAFGWQQEKDLAAAQKASNEFESTRWQRRSIDVVWGRDPRERAEGGTAGGGEESMALAARDRRFRYSKPGETFGQLADKGAKAFWDPEARKFQPYERGQLGIMDTLEQFMRNNVTGGEIDYGLEVLGKEMRKVMTEGLSQGDAVKMEVAINNVIGKMSKLSDTFGMADFFSEANIRDVRKYAETEFNKVEAERQNTNKATIDRLTKLKDKASDAADALEEWKKSLDDSKIRMETEWLGAEGGRFKTEKEALETYSDKQRQAMAEGKIQGPMRMQYFRSVTEEQLRAEKIAELRKQADQTLLNRLNQLNPEGWSEVQQRRPVQGSRSVMPSRLQFLATEAIPVPEIVQNYEDQLNRKLAEAEGVRDRARAGGQQKEAQAKIEAATSRLTAARAREDEIAKQREGKGDDNKLNQQAAAARLETLKAARELKQLREEYKEISVVGDAAAKSVVELTEALKKLEELKLKILPKTASQAKDPDKTTPKTPTDAIKDNLAAIQKALRDGNVDSLSVAQKTLVQQAKANLDLDKGLELNAEQLGYINEELKRLILIRRNETPPTDPTKPGGPDFKPTEGIDGIKPKDVGYSPQSESNQAIARAEVFMNTIKQREDLSLEEIRAAASKLKTLLEDTNAEIDALPHLAKSFEQWVYDNDFEYMDEQIARQRYAQETAKRKQLNATKEALTVEGEALSLLDDQKTLEKERLKLLRDLSLKNIDINKSLGEANQDTSKIRRLVDAFGDLQRDIAQDNIIKALAEAHKSRVTGGKTADALGKSGIDAALFGAIGETPGKAKASARDASILTEIRNRRRTNLQSAGGQRATTNWYNTMMGTLEASDGSVEEKWAQGERLEKLGLLKDGQNLTSAELKKWVASNQDNLMSILNDPALKPEQYEDVINAIRKLFDVMTEEEAIRLSLENAYQRSTDAYEHQLDLYGKGVGSIEKVNSSFQNLKKAAQDVGKFVDHDAIRKHLSVAATNTGITFASLLHESMVGAVSGDTMKSGLEAYMKGVVENPEMRRFLSDDSARQAKLAEVRAANFAEAKARAERLKKLEEDVAKAEASKKKGRKGRVDAAKKALEQAKKDNARLDNAADAEEATYGKSVIDLIREGQSNALKSWTDELEASQKILEEMPGALSLVNSAFEKLNAAAKMGQFAPEIEAEAANTPGKNAADIFVEKKLLQNIRDNSKAASNEVEYYAAAVRRNAIAASEGTAILDKLKKRFIELSGADPGTEQSKLDEMQKVANLRAQKYRVELEQTEKIYKKGTMASDTMRKAIDDANEAALDAGNYGVQNFTDSLLGGFLYSSRDFYSDLNSMAKEFSQDFRTGVASAFGEAIRGTAKLKDAFGDMLAKMADKMLDRTLQMGVNSIFDAVMPFSKGGPVKGYSTGGMVRGGSGTKDDVPAYLSKGEYVIKRSSVDALGKDFFDSLNSGRITQAATGGMISKDPKHAVQIAMMRRAEARRQRELSAAGISQFSYREADPEKKKEDWLGRETSEPVIHTKSDYKVDLKRPINSERLAAIKEVLKKYPDVGKNMDREMFDESSVEIGSGKYKAHLKNRFIFDNLKRPENAIHLRDSRLSANALTDENNPQNRFKFEKMDAFFGYQHERMQFLKDQQEAMEKHEREKQGRRYGFLFGGASLLMSSALTGGKGGYKMFAKGGQSGDDIPALLMGGEYVVRKDIVDKYGTAFFDRLNSGNIAAYATGGLVTKPHRMKPVTSSGNQATKLDAGGSGDQTNNINITVNVDAAGGVSNEITESQGYGSTPLSETETKELADRIKSTVLSTLVQEKKPGGMLY